MRAACYEESGPARTVLKIGERSMPEPGPGEMRVQVKVRGVNASDVKTRRGSGRAPGFPLTFRTVTALASSMRSAPALCIRARTSISKRTSTATARATVIFRGCNSVHRLTPAIGTRQRLMAMFVYENELGIQGDAKVNDTINGGPPAASQPSKSR
jgi:hypothetical protein